jgi:thiamine pyrophosphokinase
MRAVIFAAGQVADYGPIKKKLGKPDLVICADGGLTHAFALGLEPTLAIGDFDSASPDLLVEAERRGIPLLRLPPEKDQTDAHLALNEAIIRGASEIILVGATGDRLDHTFANLLLLPGVPVSVDVSILDAKNCIRVLRPGGRLVVKGLPGDLLSLLPLTPSVKGVVAEGVKYPLDGAVLTWGSSLGISNELVEAEAFIAVREGHLLVIASVD